MTPCHRAASVPLALVLLAAPARALGQAAATGDGRAPLTWLWLVVEVVLFAVLVWLLFSSGSPERAHARARRQGPRRDPRA